MPLKPIREDWMYFNQAARRYAEWTTGQVVPQATAQQAGSGWPNQGGGTAGGGLRPAVGPSSLSRSAARGLSGRIPRIIATIGVLLILLLVLAAMLQSGLFGLPGWLGVGGWHTGWGGPSGAALGSPLGSPSAQPQYKLVENFTKFTTKKFERWEVHTGWRYHDSEAMRPELQFCYVLMPSDAADRDIKIDLADTVRGALPYGAARAAPLTEADYATALNACTWFNGRLLVTPPPPAPAPATTPPQPDKLPSPTSPHFEHKRWTA